MSTRTTDTVCCRHPDRIAGATCRRCDRPICPECMREAPVGWQCAHCVHDDSRRAPVTRWRPSSRPAALGQTRLTPAVTALVAIDILIYLATVGRQLSVDVRFGLIPLEVAQGQWYRLVTAAFLHLNLTHLFFNMLTLAVIGPAVESAVGRVRFVAVYLLAAVGGSVASYLLGPYVIVGIGASGAIFGILGAYFVLARRSHADTRTVLALIALNLVIGFVSPGIDWRAHVGGLVVGAGVALGLSVAADHRGSSRRLWELLTVGGAVAVLGLLLLLPAGHVNL